MSGVRIYDLAKELNVSSHDILETLKEMGEAAKVPSSALPEEVAQAVRGRMAAKAGSVATAAAPSAPQPSSPAPPAGTNGTGAASANGTAHARPAPLPATPAAPEPPRQVDVPDVITLKDFATLIGVPATDIQKKLMGLGVLASLNQKLSPEVTLAPGKELQSRHYDCFRRQAEGRWNRA